MRILVLIVGVLAALLGGLWLLQGLGLVRIAPILCVADCAPLEGPSAPWAIAGFVLLGLGLFAIIRSLRRRPGA
ncbi:MAG: hypothetical protein IT535_01210 [Bauldia sp.]|nr:hypothetical protein [Bauldia sp.]